MKALLHIVLVFVTLSASAQTEFSLYRLNANLPQANLLNPAFAPNHKVVIGLPVISSIYANVDLDGIAFRDIFINSETDSLRLDTLNFPDKLRASNEIRMNEVIQLFYFGLRMKRSYISFGIHQVGDVRLSYPGDLVGWAIRGPGDSRYAGRPLDLSNFYSRALAYNKASINYARDITPNLRIGARFNYLLGVASGETTRISGELLVGIDSVNINTGELRVQSAGYDFFNQNGLGVSDYVNFFVKTKNKGVAWDFGAAYQLTRRLSVSAAVNDIGYISWKEYTRSYTVAPINYTFRGVDFLDYINQSPGQKSVDSELDSLTNLFTAAETTGEAFKTALIGKFYAGLNYHILGINNFSANVYFDLFQKKITPALSLGYNLQLGRFLSATVGATFKDRKINHVGAGIAIKLLNLQVYAASDRANTFAYPARASRADVHLGANLVFGKPKKNDKDDNSKEKEKEKEEEKKEEPKKEPEVKKEEPVMEDSIQATAPAPDTVRAMPPPVAQVLPEVKEEPKEEVKPFVQETAPPVTTAPVTVAPPVVERHEVVTQGVHKDELPVSHFVVVGTFRLRQNANTYSRALRAKGFPNQFGYVSEKGMYYVSVHRSKDLEETRRVRDEFRRKTDFQFPSSWVLTVQD